MSRTDNGYTYTCDVCDKSVQMDVDTLPDKWTLGYFHTFSGYQWNPKIYLCDSCWQSPKVSSPAPAFKSLWHKFGWAKQTPPTEKE